MFLVGVAAAALRFATPLLWAALGESLAQRAGVLNVGVEGIMLVGAFAAGWGAAVTGSPWVGVGLAIVSGVLMAGIHAVLCLRFHLDQIVAGTALAILGLGLSGFGFRLTLGAEIGRQYTTFTVLDLGALSQIPILGPILFQHHALVYLGLALVPLLAWFIGRTSWGLAIRAAGERPEAAHAAGIDVFRTRFACVLAAGALGAVGGAYLSVAQVGNFVEDMIAGRGFIAIACVLYGRWKPRGIQLATLFFGATDAAQIRLQALRPDIPYQFFAMLPYVLAIGALVFFSRRSRMPAALTQPFVPAH